MEEKQRKEPGRESSVDLSWERGKKIQLRLRGKLAVWWLGILSMIGLIGYLILRFLSSGNP